MRLFIRAYLIELLTLRERRGHQYLTRHPLLPLELFVEIIWRFHGRGGTFRSDQASVILHTVNTSGMKLLLAAVLLILSKSVISSICPRVWVHCWTAGEINSAGRRSCIYDCGQLQMCTKETV
jgi:hypothetical protein